MDEEGGLACEGLKSQGDGIGYPDKGVTAEPQFTASGAEGLYGSYVPGALIFRCSHRLESRLPLLLLQSITRLASGVALKGLSYHRKMRCYLEFYESTGDEHHRLSFGKFGRQVTNPAAWESR
jgi:hypothetical protein